MSNATSMRAAPPGAPSATAIARALGASVATRDVDGFEKCGIEVINPWTGEQPQT